MMRVPIAGDRGYLGAVVVPSPRRATDVGRLDAAWYHGCDFGLVERDHELRTSDIRDVRPDEFHGINAVANVVSALTPLRNSPARHGRCQ
jgi:hypothetical protein